MADARSISVDADKAQGVIAQQRSENRPAKQMHPLFDPFKKRHCPARRSLLAQFPQLNTRGVDAFPHLRRRAARTAWALFHAISTQLKMLYGLLPSRAKKLSRLLIVKRAWRAWNSS